VNIVNYKINNFDISVKDETWWILLIAKWASFIHPSKMGLVLVYCHPSNISNDRHQFKFNLTKFPDISTLVKMNNYLNCFTFSSKQIYILSDMWRNAYFLETKSHNSATSEVKIFKIKRSHVLSILRLCRNVRKFGQIKFELMKLKKK
jgi:hypothetical protein